MEKENVDQITAIVEIDESRPITPAERILAPLELSDYSQFLYETNYRGKPGKDFTSEGVKTLGLKNGISTGDVRIEFLNDEKTEALFYCTATDRNNDTSQRVVKQTETENGRVPPHWIEKGIARAERNAIKARLPIQLFKTALQRAITAGEANQSAIVEAQQALGIAWTERDESLSHINKPALYKAAQVEYGESEYWDAETWMQIVDDLKTLAEWVKAVS